MSWVSVIPDVLVCVGLFFAPGLLASYLGGLRGITAWAMAPLVTVAAVAAVAVLGGLLGFRFGVWPAAAGTVVVAGLAAGLSLVLRARGVARPPGDPRSYSLAVGVGAVAAVVIGTVTFVTGVRRPDAISQSNDAVFHYNAVRYIEQTGKASPLGIGTLGQPGGRGTFYPDAWHAMAALLAELTGASIPVAATVTCLVVAVLVWPLSCLLLARHLFGASGGRAAAAVVITGMLSSLFGAFPWVLTGPWGVLWPNALGMALAPAGVALGMSILRVSDGDTFGPVRRWFFGQPGGWAIAIAHPNAALSVALICLFPLLVVVGPYLFDQWNRHTLRTTLGLLAIGAMVIIGNAIIIKLPIIRFVRRQGLPITETPGKAIVNAFGNGTYGQVPEWLLAAFLIVGVVACFAWRQRRWLVSAELVIVALYVGSAAIHSHVVRLFTGLWYNDPQRIAAMLPVVAIPLITTGVLAAGEWLQRVPFRAAVARRPAVALALPLVVGTVVAVTTAAQSVPDNAHVVGSSFNTGGDENLTTASKLQFLRTVARLVPSTALVADNPFAGTAYLFAMSGTRVLYPQLLQGSHSKDLSYLAGTLVQLSQDQRACDLVRRYGVGYMIIAPDDFPLGGGNPTFYGGVVSPGRNPGFRLVASAADGQLKLYQITMCQPSNQPGTSVEAASHGG